jgi:hypothetical protein
LASNALKGGSGTLCGTKNKIWFMDLQLGFAILVIFCERSYLIRFEDADIPTSEDMPMSIWVKTLFKYFLIPFVTKWNL